MSENPIGKRQNNVSKLATKIMVLLYIAIVIVLGSSYALKSMSGNLGTIISYFSGTKGFPNDALIYTCIIESIFISLSTAGSVLSVMVLLLTSWKIKSISIIVHYSTTLTYILSRITLIQATVHLSTQGAIKNTEFWDFKMIFEHIIGSSVVFRSSLILILGIFMIPFLLRVEGKLSNSEYKT